MCKGKGSRESHLRLGSIRRDLTETFNVHGSINFCHPAGRYTTCNNGCAGEEGVVNVVTDSHNAFVGSKV